MNRCPDERALVRIYLKDGTAAEEAHVRRCAACAERYDAVGAEMQLIGEILNRTPPPIRVVRRGGVGVGWIPAAAVAALLVVLGGLAWLRRPAILEPAVRQATVATFAAEMSAALFGPAAGDHAWQVASEAPHLGTTLDGGWSCAQYRLFSGECDDDDHVAALLATTE